MCIVLGVERGRLVLGGELVTDEVKSGRLDVCCGLVLVLFPLLQL